jgi:hypothetical protein
MGGEKLDYPLGKCRMLPEWSAAMKFINHFLITQSLYRVASARG